MTKSLDNNDFLNGYGCFSCFQTLLKVKVSGNREKTKSLEYGKCPETGITVKSFEYVKCPETGKTA